MDQLISNPLMDAEDEDETVCNSLVIMEEVNVASVEEEGGVDPEVAISGYDDSCSEDLISKFEPKSETEKKLKPLSQSQKKWKYKAPGPENRYTCKERIRIIQLYAENENNPRRVQRIFQVEFQKKPPATRTITKLYKKFVETGSVQNNYSKIRPRKSRTKENVEKVKLAFQKTPTKSIRKIAQELQIPHTTVGRILQELKGKEGGQIRRSRTLKVGTRTEKTSISKTNTNSTKPGNDISVASVAMNSSQISGSDSSIHQSEGAESMRPNTAVETVMTQQQTVASQTIPASQPSPSTALLTLPNLPSNPSSIFIVHTSPRDILSSVFFCLDFACRKHASQTRKVLQTPYINRPIGIANILINEGLIGDTDIVQAAVLRDTLEETDTTLVELRANFGNKVASLVEEVTDDKSLAQDMRKLLQIQNSAKKSYGAQLIGMADKIYNLRDLMRLCPVGWTQQRRFEYVLWAQEVVRSYYPANDSLANILKEIFAQWNVLS